MGKLIGLLVAVVVATGLFSQTARGFEPDEIVSVGAYCNTTDIQVAKDLTKAVALGGTEGYTSFINGANFCFDVRLHAHMGIKIISVRLVEKLWDFENLDDGQQIEMWRLKDSVGQFGFTWVPAAGPDPIKFTPA